jgi:uncharacterized integral membrane protein
MALVFLLVAILAAAVAVFALQNSAQTSVRFLVWTLDGLPVAAIALVSLGIGLVVAGVPLWFRCWRWSARARSAEARAASLDKALAEREQALLQRPPPSAPPPPR